MQVSESLASRILCLPLSHDLKQLDVELLLTLMMF